MECRYPNRVAVKKLCRLPNLDAPKICDSLAVRRMPALASADRLKGAMFQILRGVSLAGSPSSGLNDLVEKLT